MVTPPRLAFHPLCSPFFPKQKIGFGPYRYMMSYPQWNRVLKWIRRAKAWDDAIDGAWLLLERTERYEKQLGHREFIRNQIQIYLFLLNALRRANRMDEFKRLWEKLETRNDLTIRYNVGSPAARSRYVITQRDGVVEVSLLWLARSFHSMDTVGYVRTESCPAGD